MRYFDSETMSPFDRVRVANEIAIRSAMDAPLRRLAAVIVRDAWNIPKQAGTKIARWIRTSFQYTLEAPGVEILQGPYTSLKTRVVDCDDAAILWQSLTRSIGLQTYFCGVGQISKPDVLLHAIGHDPTIGKLFEVVSTEAYSGEVTNLEFQLPAGFFAIYWSPEPGLAGFYVRSSDDPNFYRSNSNVI